MNLCETTCKSTILAYHHVCDHKYPTITRVTPNQFKKQIDFLKTNNYEVKNLSDTFLSPTKSVSKTIVNITFDDAFSCVNTNALTILKDNNLSATIFVITKYIGKNFHWDYYKTSDSCRHLSWEQIREISEWGFEIGSHSHSHRDLKSMNSNEIKFELDYSKKLLEDKLGKEINYFSYPFGRFDSRTSKQCREAGYLGAVTMAPKNTFTNYFELPRHSVYLFDDLLQYGFKFENNLLSKLERVKLKVINSFSLGTIVLNTFKRK
jgi:peptidoglycan/xylan/chitin deacetylase (PgdA/CDA1 family)